MASLPVEATELKEGFTRYCSLLHSLSFLPKVEKPSLSNHLSPPPFPTAAGLSGLYLPIDADMTNARLSPNSRFAPGDRPMAAISHWGRNIVASEQFDEKTLSFQEKEKPMSHN